MIGNLVFLRCPVSEMTSSVEGCALDADGAVLHAGLLPLAEWAHYAEGRRVVAAIPGRESSFLRVSLPPMPKRQVAQALPFAIEDRLVDELAALHLAIGDVVSVADGVSVSVEVVSRDVLERVCTRLEQAGLPPHALFVDAAALGDGVDDRVWLDREEVHVRTSRGERSSLSRANWLALQESSAMPWVNAAAEVHDEDPRWLPTQLLECGAINLLQGDWASRAAVRHPATRRWRWVAGLALLALVLQGAIGVMDWRRVHAQESAVDAELVALAQPVLPLGASASEALARLREATAVRGAVNPVLGSPALEVMGLLATASAEVELSSLTSESQIVELSFATRDSTPELTSLERSLQAAGWGIERIAGVEGSPRWRLTRTETP